MAKTWRRELAFHRSSGNGCQLQKASTNKPETARARRYQNACRTPFIDGPEQEAVLRLGLELTIGYNDWGETDYARWNSSGRPKIRDYAPYLTHVLTVDLFFYLAMAASQIGSQRSSNKADIAYLYYLPFCMVFTSRRQLAGSYHPTLPASRSGFVHGDDLKGGFEEIGPFITMPAGRTEEGGCLQLCRLSSDDDSYLVTQLWKKHMTPPSISRQHPSKYEARLYMCLLPAPTRRKSIKALDDFERTQSRYLLRLPSLWTRQQSFKFTRFIRQRKGKWVRVPENV